MSSRSGDSTPRQIGVVTDDGMLRVKDHGIKFAEIPNRALADEAPKYNRLYTTPLAQRRAKARRFTAKTSLPT